VALGIVVIENLPAPSGKVAASGRPAAPAAPAAEPPPKPAALDGDVLVLRLGGPGGAAGKPAAKAQAPAPRAAQPAEEPPAAAATYVVQPGDTLSGIAARELGSARLADELARLNGITDPGALRIGQVLKLR
jgi:LysM domain